MPVLILAAAEDLDIVRPLAARLLADGGEVRAYLDDDDFELRNMGCKLALGSLDDEINLEGALTNVHTFIPILTDPARVSEQSSLDRLVELGLACAHAAAAASIAQTILPLSIASGSDNALGQGLARIEQEFRESTEPLCVLRVGFLWGPERPLLACIRALGRPDAGLARDARVRVVQVEDFVVLVTSADDREGLSGTWELAGEEHPLRELQALAGAGEAKEPGPWFEQVLAEGLKGGSSATSEFGVVARRLEEGADR